MNIGDMHCKVDSSKQINISYKEPLVSIIMPAYNCEQFIGYALDSIIAQTYQNWEVIVIDDCSTDKTFEIVAAYAQKDPRIKCHKFSENRGAAISRNKAVDLAQGKYIAFLDSDDIWFPTKLEKQIKFMRENGYFFTCTSYTKIDEKGNQINRIIKAKPISDYNGILKNSPGNLTVVYDAEALGKFKIPDIKKRNDYVMWLQVIKKAKYLYGLEEPLASHRIRKGSLSRNKVSLVSWHWKVYRNIERLPIIKSIWLICYIIITSILKIR